MIAILSDTHNNLTNLQAALEICRAEGVTTLIHCGDVTSPEVARYLSGFRVILTFGNGDYASGEILNELKRLDSQNSAAMTFSGEVEGLRVGVTHGHLPGEVDELVRGGAHEFVFRGHSHRHMEEQVGITRLVNPGALGGLHREPRQFCLLDPNTGVLRFVVL